MSRRVKELLEREIRNRLAGVGACVVVDYSGVSAEETVALRRRLGEQNVRMLVVKNSLARRALGGTGLESAARLLAGPSAVCWGAEDPMSLARVVKEQSGGAGAFSIRGASVEGRTLSARQVAELAALPTRTEMIGIIAARALGPVQHLLALMQAPAQRLAGQIKTLAEREA